MNLPPEDSAIIGLIAHGFTADLDKSNFKQEWLQHPLSRLAVSAAISLARDGQDVNAISVIARGKLPSEVQPEIMRIFKNGYGNASLKDATEHSYQTFILGKMGEVAREIGRQSESSPRDVNKWLPVIATQLVQLIRDGDTYDPRPSSHAKKELPRIFSPSLITGMNAMLRGGYRSGSLIVYAGVTAHGKTTTLNSHIIDLLLQGFTVTAIRTENTEQQATAEIASAIGGFNLEKEVENKQWRDTETETPTDRESRYKETVEWLDDKLTVYGPEWCNDERLKRIAKWNKPQAIVIDYLKDQPGMFTGRSGYSKDTVGDFADWLLVFAKDNGIWLGTAGQVSGDATKKMLKGAWVTASPADDRVMLYGSVRVEQASDEFILARRHPGKNNFAQFKVQKERKQSKLDDKHEIPIDIDRRILEIQRLKT